MFNWPQRYPTHQEYTYSLHRLGRMARSWPGGTIFVPFLAVHGSLLAPGLLIDLTPTSIPARGWPCILLILLQAICGPHVWHFFLVFAGGCLVWVFPCTSCISRNSSACDHVLHVLPGWLEPYGRHEVSSNQLYTVSRSLSNPQFALWCLHGVNQIVNQIHTHLTRYYQIR